MTMKSHVIASILLLALVAGCTADQLAFWDHKAQAATQPGAADSVGIIASIVTGNPVTGAMVSNLAFIAASAWLYIRKGKYKSALRTVVNTVEPYIPEGDIERNKLKEAQGPSVTALVKKVKA